MNVLDENIVVSQRELLRSWTVRFRRIGGEVGRLYVWHTKMWIWKAAKMAGAACPTLKWQDRKTVGRAVPAIKLARLQHNSRSWCTAHIGMKDREDIIPLLHTLQRPTFFTHDHGFYHPTLLHTRYCLVFLEVGADDIAKYIRRFLRHRAFRTRAQRMGKIIRVRQSGITYWQVHRRGERGLRLVSRITGGQAARGTRRKIILTAYCQYDNVVSNAREASADYTPPYGCR